MSGSGQNRTGFAWTNPRARAAVLLADDELTDEQIAAEVGVSRTQLATWKTHPAFIARIDELAHELESRVLRQGIARRRRRIAALNDRWDRMRRLLEDRGQEYAGLTPGGSTGLLVRQVKLTPSGLQVEEYAVDTGLLKELREHEKQAAQELGEWTERREVTGKDGGPIEIADARQRLAARLTALIELVGPDEAPGEPE